MTDRIARAVEALEAAFGAPVWSGPRDPLQSLVGAILSQNTTDTNRDRALSALLQRYPDWDDILRADDTELAAVIRVAGLSNQRSKRIISLVQWTKHRFGGFDLSEICSWEFEHAVEELGKLPGIGIKTIAAMVGEEPDTIEEVYEPFLIQEGYILKTPRGRVLAGRGYEHLGLKPIAPKGDETGSLF